MSSFWHKVGSGLKTVGHAGVRVGTAFASGGASEAYRATMHKADPVTAYGERYVDKAGRAIEHALTPETGAAPAGPDGPPREAPQVAAPPPITAARVAAPSTVTSSFDSTNADQGRNDALAQQAYLRSVMEGKGAPSAAEIAARRAGAQAIAGQYAMAAGQHGYSQAGARAAARNAGALGQQVVGQVAETRAAEAAQARQEYANLLLGTRSQDISLAGTKGQQELEAAKANQSAKLTADLTNAGFDQQATIKMSDQQLQAALANAGYKLSQQQLDDLRQYQRAEIEQKYRDAKARGDAADEAFWGDLLTKAASYGGAPAAGGGGTSAGSFGNRQGPDDTLPVNF